MMVRSRVVIRICRISLQEHKPHPTPPPPGHKCRDRGAPFPQCRVTNRSFQSQSNCSVSEMKRKSLAYCHLTISAYLHSRNASEILRDNENALAIIANFIQTTKPSNYNSNFKLTMNQAVTGYYFFLKNAHKLDCEPFLYFAILSLAGSLVASALSLHSFSRLRKRKRRLAVYP